MEGVLGREPEPNVKNTFGHTLRLCTLYSYHHESVRSVIYRAVYVTKSIVSCFFKLKARKPVGTNMEPANIATSLN